MLTLHKPSGPPKAPATDADALVRLLTDLYRQQLDLTPNNNYLRTHGRPRTVRNHVRNFLWYEQFLPESGVVLDWGCNHAPDSCLLRARFGEQFELHACDFRPPGSYPVFHDFADVAFKPLHDVVKLPYPGESFDVVIGSGTLEHTALPHESLKRLYRVLRPDGLLVITYLPNRWSVQELVRRTLKRPGFHHRLYGLGETVRLLKDHGFLPLAVEHQTCFWNGVGEKFGASPGAIRVLKWCLPVHVFGSTLRVVARKMISF
jgi:SAM-dependent methyltransferase